MGIGTEVHPVDFNWVLGQMDANIKIIMKTLDTHGLERKEVIVRVEKLESKMNKAAGVLMVFSTFFTVAATYIWKKVVG